MKRRPDLIVPIRDRRRRKRILTLRNFAIFCCVMLIAFLAVNIRSEMRDLVPGNYGRLFRREVPATVKPKPMEVVREEPVDDATHADPTLVQPMQRSSWLTDDTTTTTTTSTPVVVSAASMRGEADVAIVGGTEGVTIVKRERKRPVLSGGFGR